MPLPQHILDELGEKRERESKLASKDQRRAMAGTALACMGWCAIGLFFLAWSFHTTDEMLGRAAFWGGLGVGNGGMIFTLLRYYRKGEDRGDW